MPSFAALRTNDEHDQQLQANVHPPGWQNPRPEGTYHLVVIGAGTAGLVTAAGAAGLGARVALVERGLMGGDCLNVGCVPSKGVLRAARAAAEVETAGRFGVRIPEGTSTDFAAAMQRMRRLRAKISPNDSAARFCDMGVDVYFGQARFTSSRTVDVDGTELRFKKAVIATGTRPAVPRIADLDQVEYLTNESIFALSDLPPRLGVIGAGPIGCELAQAFARFGSEVFLVESKHGILSRDDRDAAGIVAASLRKDGVQLVCCGRELHVSADGRAIRLQAQSHDTGFDQQVDQLLVAVGRTPSVEGLGLERIGVAYTGKGVEVNDRLQTTNPNIFAAGDVCSSYRFTHAADFMARIVVRNALLPWPINRARVSRLVIPWCTYTAPELAHVGLSAAEALRQGQGVVTLTQPLAEVDRAVLEGEEEGFVKVHLQRGTGQILGATVVAATAGEMISQFALAMTHGLGIEQFASTIYPYPTRAEAVRKLGDQYQKSRLTPTTQAFLKAARWLAGMG